MVYIEVYVDVWVKEKVEISILQFRSKGTVQQTTLNCMSSVIKFPLFGYRNAHCIIYDTFDYAN